MADQEVQIHDEKLKNTHDEDDSDSDHDHEGHDHEGHDHDDKDKKANRGEKKFKKAMVKLGLKPMTGITRVTIKKGKNLLLYIEDPEVFRTPGVENSFIVFGEPKMNDFPGNIAADEAKKFKDTKPELQVQPEKQEQSQTTQSVGDDEQLDESKISAEAIKMVMEHCKCDRKVAVKALIEQDGDSVNAILKLSS